MSCGQQGTDRQMASREGSQLRGTQAISPSRPSTQGLPLAKRVCGTLKVPLLCPSPTPNSHQGNKPTCPDVFCTHWAMIRAGVINPLVPVQQSLPLLLTAVLIGHPHCQDSALAQASPSLDRPSDLLSPLFLACQSPGKAESYGQAPGCLQDAN